jgi:hypothetical protein
MRQKSEGDTDHKNDILEEEAKNNQDKSHEEESM